MNIANVSKLKYWTSLYVTFKTSSVFDRLETVHGRLFHAVTKCSFTHLGSCSRFAEWETVARPQTRSGRRVSGRSVIVVRTRSGRRVSGRSVKVVRTRSGRRVGFITRALLGNFWLWILKRRTRGFIHVQLILFVYLERFRRYSTFLFGVISLYREWIFFGFWIIRPVKPLNRRKTLAARAKVHLLSHCVCNHLFGLCRYARNKSTRSHKVCIFHVCVVRPLASGFQPRWSGSSHQRIQACKVLELQIEKCQCYEMLKFPCSIGKPSRP